MWNYPEVRIEEWLEEELVGSGFDREKAKKVALRMPKFMRSEEMENILNVEGMDYESLEGLRLFLSSLGRALLVEGKGGEEALSRMLNEFKDKGGALGLMVDWYRIALKNGIGLMI